MPLVAQKSCKVFTPLAVVMASDPLVGMMASNNCSAYKLMLIWFCQYSILLNDGELMVNSWFAACGIACCLSLRVAADSGLLFTLMPTLFSVSVNRQARSNAGSGMAAATLFLVWSIA